MNELIKQYTRWMHYIGRYYRSHHAFIREAKVMGIARRIPAQVARGMNYGDTVVLLRYCRKERVYAFAEMVITGLVLSGDMAQAVGEKLQAQGKATYTAGGGMISRECGSYMIMGTWNVDAELPEVMDIVTEIAAEKGMDATFVMISGELTTVYDDPVYLDPAPPFTRGFIRVDDGATFTLFGEQEEPGNKIIAIESYQKKDRKCTRSPRRSKSSAIAPALL